MSSNVVERLITHEIASTCAPASPEAIEAVARHLKVPLPGLLVELWRKSDGLFLDPLDCHIYGPAEALQMLTEYGEGALTDAGLLPFIDDQESNLLAVYIKGPRAFRVLYLPHDDGSRLIYRSVESSFHALIACADEAEMASSYFRESEGDYPPDEPRTEDDHEAAKRLIAGKHERDEWNHAVQLLDASNVQEWRLLLETDHFVRRDARERMQKMSSPIIQAILAQDQEAFDEFVTQAADASRQAGLNVGRCERGVLQIDGHWMNLDSFFHRRHISNAFPRMIAWFTDITAGCDPHLRAGNFHAD